MKQKKDKKENHSNKMKQKPAKTRTKRPIKGISETRTIPKPVQRNSKWTCPLKIVSGHNAILPALKAK
jgi:hypothetical protein